MVLSLGSGSCKTGFQTVTAQLWQGSDQIPIKFSGGLPPAPELEALYRRWQVLYQALYARLHWRRPDLRRGCETSGEQSFDRSDSDLFGIEFDHSDDPNRVSEAEFHQVCQQLERQLNQWLQSPAFVTLDQRLRTRLDANQPLQVTIETDDGLLRHLPWHLWNLLESCPEANIAVSAQDYERVETALSSRTQLRILAILGHSEGIDIQQDRQVLEQLPDAEIVFLTEPQRSDVDQWLWHPEGWDILFFAGHSSSQHSEGRLYLNPSETLTVEQLRNALKAAIRRGLQLAIFNSCDGLGLARTLGDLNIPQLIVMREPVPDQVAQVFLKHFLQLFSTGESFFSAVRQARERLQGLEGRFPCASWLPTICQNPAAPSLTWPVPLRETADSPSLAAQKDPMPSESTASEDAGPDSTDRDGRFTVLPASVQPLASKPLDRSSASTDAEVSQQQGTGSPDSERCLPAHRWRSLGLSLITALGVAAGVMGIRTGGHLRPLELWTYDQLIQRQPDEEPDDRLLLVEVTEADLRQYGWPLSDEVLVQLLKTLNAAQPRVIGVDIFRDLPQEPGNFELRQFWQQHDNAIAICLHSDVNNLGIPPPPGLPSEQVGFNDVPLDANDTVRRQLWAMGPTTRSECTTQLSFSLALALRYLQAEGIEATRNPDGSIQLGKMTVERLRHPAGGYQDLAGYQTMLRYRRHRGSADGIVQTVRIEDLLEGQVSEALIRDRVVLLGLTAHSIQDSFRTPYGEKLRGVMLHAQMVSQILSAVLEGRSLITVWPLAGELVWVGAWSLMGGLLAWRVRSQRRYPWLMLAGVLMLTAGSAGLLRVGLWIPLVPSGLSLLLSSVGVRAIKHRSEHRSD